MNVPTRVARLIDQGADVASRAPGRANLIGEHTDYNDGLVLPIALDLATYVVGSRAPDVALVSDDEAEPARASLAEPRIPLSGWGRYVAGVIAALRDAGAELHGVHGSVIGDVPIGAGLSSSAALEVSVALSLLATEMPAPALAAACRRAENFYVGVQSGIMDQLTSAAAREGYACLIDCRDNSIDYIPFPDALTVLIVDSGVRRDLRSSAFNDRVAECKAAAAAFGVDTLRALTLDDVAAKSGIPPTLRRRAQHVVSENERVRASAAAFASGDTHLLSEIFAASHASYSQDFEASTPEIDEMVRRAAATDGVLAARLTGGGWGGCTVNLVEKDAPVQEIAAAIGGARWWTSSPAPGAGSLV